MDYNWAATLLLQKLLHEEHDKLFILWKSLFYYIIKGSFT